MYNISKVRIIDTFKEEFGLDIKVAKSFWGFLFGSYMKLFKKERRFLSHLKKKFQNSDKGITMNLPLYNVEYTYYCTDNPQIKLNLTKGKETDIRQVRVTYTTNKVDGRKRNRSFDANLLQALDAHVKHYVVEEFRSKGYHIHAIHDCFKVHPNHADFAIAAYNRAIVNISEIFIEDLKDCKGFTCFTEEQKQQILNANYSINAF